MTNLLYEHTEYDITVVCGDFNSRIGKECDFVPEIDDIPTRVIIDEVNNSDGTALCDFLLENKLAVVNGQICPLKDNFTCVSSKGKSVVDYFVVSQENFENITDFEVLPVSELVDSMNLHELARGRVSDHAILSCTIKLSYNVPPAADADDETTEAHLADHAGNQCNASEQNRGQYERFVQNAGVENIACNTDPPPRKFRIKKVPSNFL